MPAPTVVFYVSGHGFGHASRTIEVINALGERRPDAHVQVRTTAARWLFDLTLAKAAEYVGVPADVGVTQIDALVPDLRATMARAREFYGDIEPLIENEARALEAARASLVVADMPPVAFAAAQRAGVRSIALGNFTWDWIYEDYAKTLGLESEVADVIRGFHRLATEAWRLPMHGGFEGFARVRDLPLVARRSRRTRADTRRRLGWTDAVPVVLASFGGVGVRGLSLSRVAEVQRIRVVTTDEPSGHRGSGPLVRTSPGGLGVLDERQLYAEGLRYEDVVAAADVVLTKPGYGIVAECIANQTAMLFTSRGQFAEYEALVGAMPRWLRCRYIDRQSLLEARWEPSVSALLDQPPPPETPAVDGAEVAADWIAELLS